MSDFIWNHAVVFVGYEIDAPLATSNSVLSAFEESSAACISDMLRQVSNGQYLEAIRMAEKFILHVEVLFATIDDLEWQFARLNLKGTCMRLWLWRRRL